MKVICLLMFVSMSSALAQNRSIYFKFKNVQLDTAKKQIIFRYRLGNIAPKDSLGISIIRASGKVVKLTSVYGDVGTTLTDGGRKTILWNPIADRQKFDEQVTILFTIKKDSTNGITRKQSIDLVRWGLTAALVGYSAVEGFRILNAVRSYNRADLPITISQKESLDADMNTIIHRQRQFYTIAAISAAALVANGIISMMQRKYKLGPNPLKLKSSQECAGIVYTF